MCIVCNVTEVNTDQWNMFVSFLRTMFGFLGLRKDSKKSTTEKEADGGFVMIGEEQSS